MSGLPTAESLREQLGRLLASDQFRHAQQLSRFLRFTVEATIDGRATEIKESVLGIEVFGRGNAYDPRIDPIVRVTARTLRNRLQDYYTNGGANDAVIIEYPKGSYVPVFRVASSAARVESDVPSPNGTDRNPSVTVVDQGPLAPATARPNLSSKHRLTLMLGAISAAIAIWIGFQQYQRRTTEPPKLTRLTAEVGLATDPALSRGAQFVAYASDRSGRGDLDIYIQSVVGGDAMRLTDDPADDYQPVFSPDGGQVAFRSDRERGGVYLVPTLGGPATLFAEGGANPRFSPDSQFLTFEISKGRVHPHNPGSGAIFVKRLAGGEPQRIQPEFAAAHSPNWVGPRQILFLGVPKIAAQGDRLDLITVEAESNLDWWVTSIDGGPPVRTGAASFLKREHQGIPRWDPRMGFRPNQWINSGVIFTASNGGAANLWKLPLSTETWRVAGSPQQLTFGTAQARAPSEAADHGFAFSATQSNVEIYALPIDGSSAKPIGSLRRLTENADVDQWPSLSRDGHTLVFLSNRMNQSDIWRQDLVRGEKVRLTNDSRDKRWPEISPDGREVSYYVFDPTSSSSNPRISTLRMSINGRPLGEVCERCIYMGRTSDGSKLLYGDWTGRRMTVRDTKSGIETRFLTAKDGALETAQFSPDDKWVVFVAARWPARSEVVVTPFRNGTPPSDAEWVRITAIADSAYTPLWSADSNVIYYKSQRDGYDCLWAQRLRATDKRPIGDPVFTLHLHHAGKRLGNTGGRFRGMSVASDKIVFPLLEVASNIWLLRN